MGQLFNVYCDESCHLEYDHHPAMVLGAIWCPAEKSQKVAEEIRGIKQRYGLSPWFEIKWTKVSPAKLSFYLELVDYFFVEPDLHFRALVAPKENLRHPEFNQTHDLWYYKMYFDMLKIIFSPIDHYRIYLDIKDTHGGDKVRTLHEVLSNNIFDFSREIIERIQIVRSHEVEILQLADLLIGIISGVNHGPILSPAKNALIEQMRQKSGYTLIRSTLYREMKVNLFYWKPKMGE
jgi:hypothetical protein